MTEQIDQDRAVERTLAALGSATPPEGMHDRLLSRLHQHEDQAIAAMPPHRFLAILGGWPVMLALSVTAAAVLAMTVLLHKPRHRNAPAQNAARVEAPIAPRAAVTSVPQKQEQAMLTRNVHAVVSTYSAALSSAKHNGSNAPVITSAETGFPPPPMPLTEQEKLLVRLAHHGDAVELAELNTQALDAAFEAQKIQFNDFFYIRPKEPDNEDQPQQ